MFPAADPEVQEPFAMKPERSRSLQITVLIVSIACSLVSLTALVIRPHETESWRASLNVIAVVLVLLAATVLARRSGGQAT
jgi:hypothetical protein